MRLRNSKTYKAKKSNLHCTLEMAHSEDSVPKMNPYTDPTSLFTKQNAGVHDAIKGHHPERNRTHLFFCLIILTAPLILLALASRNRHREKAQAEVAKVTRDEGLLSNSKLNSRWERECGRHPRAQCRRTGHDSALSWETGGYAFLR